MTYICVCGHDYSEHMNLNLSSPNGATFMPCDHEDCECQDYEEAR